MRKSVLLLVTLCMVIGLASPLITLAQDRSSPIEASAPKRVLLPIVLKQHRITPPGQTGVVPLSGKPYSLSLNPNNGRFYVARYGSKDVAVLDLYNLSWITNRPLSKGPQAIRVNPTLGRAYASYGDPLYVINCANNAVLGQIPDGVYTPSEIAVNSVNHRVYVVQRAVFVGDQDKVHVYDGNSLGRIGTLDLGAPPEYVQYAGLAVNRTTGIAYAAYTLDQKIAVIGTNSQITARITPSEMAVSPYRPWVAVNSFTNRLYLRGQTRSPVINLANNSQIGTLNKAGLIAVDEVRNLVYVQYLSKIYVYDGSNNKLREITLDKYRYVTDIACDAATRRIFLAAPNDNEIVVVAD